MAGFNSLFRFKKTPLTIMAFAVLLFTGTPIYAEVDIDHIKATIEEAKDNRDTPEKYLSQQAFEQFQRHSDAIAKNVLSDDPLKKAKAMLGDKKFNELQDWTTEQQKKFYHQDFSKTSLVDDNGNINVNALQHQQTLGDVDNPIYSTPRLIVFLSRSIPDASLKAWYQQTRDAGGRVAFKGFIDNDETASIQFSGSFLKDELFVFDIDPAMFERLEIESVPAVAIVKESFCVKAPCDIQVDKVTGDIGLVNALELIRDKGEHFQHEAHAFREAMRRRY